MSPQVILPVIFSNLIVPIVNCIASIEFCYHFVILCEFENVINNLYMCCLCSLARTDCKNRLLPKTSILEF